MNRAEIVCTLLLPVAFVVIGLLLWKRTPKKNDWVGWRTASAMKNEETFRRANQYAGKRMSILGAAELLVTLLVLFAMGYAEKDSIMPLLLCLGQTLLFVVLIVVVEKKRRP